MARAWSSVGSKSERTIHGGVRRWLNEIRKDMVKRAEDLAPDRGAGTQTRAIDPELIEQILFDPHRFSVVFNKATKKGTDDAISEALRRLNIELKALGLPTIDAPDFGVSGSLKMTDKAFTALLAAREIRIKGINDAMKKDIRRQLLASADQLESVSQLAARVREVMNGMASRGRSLRIARTETGITASGTRFLGMEKSGVQQVRWISAADARDSHRSFHTLSAEAAAAGEAYPMGTNFLEKIGKAGLLRFPLDEAGPVGEIVNCRCALVAVIPPPPSE